MGSWGGEINLSTNDATGSFKIELSGIPQDECTQLAKFQADAWLAVGVNGNALESDNTITDNPYENSGRTRASAWRPGHPFAGC